MGPANSHTQTHYNYNIQQVFYNAQVISKSGNISDKYLMKTYHTTSQQQHRAKVQYFKQYKKRMEENQEITNILEIIQQKQEGFCSNTFKTHLIYQFSSVSIHSEIRERQKKMIKLKGNNFQNHQTQYFSYDDLCNILYSCLSALWLIQQSLESGCIDNELKMFKTIFLTTKNILIFQDGAIKIMDPHAIGYQSRYTKMQDIYYSPQKLADFYRIDDEKSSIFQLGMMMLEICLLESLSSTYSHMQFLEQSAKQKLNKARKLYSSSLEKQLGVSLFDIIQKMININRRDRFSLKQVINYAEEMYEPSEQAFASKINTNESQKKDNSYKKNQLKLTNHSSSGKKHSCSGLEKFYHFKDSLITQKNGLENQGNVMSPKISNFTIEEVSDQKQQQSSMLQSFKVLNPQKNPEFSESIVNGGIFSNLKLNDSYNYVRRFQKPKQPQLFTDPELLKTIYRQLQLIQQRKRQKGIPLDMKSSCAVERKDRFYMEQQSLSKITNRVYLND